MEIMQSLWHCQACHRCQWSQFTTCTDEVTWGLQPCSQCNCYANQCASVRLHGNCDLLSHGEQGGYQSLQHAWSRLYDCHGTVNISHHTNQSQWEPFHNECLTSTGYNQPHTWRSKHPHWFNGNWQGWEKDHQMKMTTSTLNKLYGHDDISKNIVNCDFW